MTLMFAPVVGLLAGVLLGRWREGYALTGLTWYRRFGGADDLSREAGGDGLRR